MYKVITGLAIPDNLPQRAAGAPKYPFADLQVGSSFVVPYGDRNKDETDEAFGARIKKSARAFASRDLNQQVGEGGKEATRKEFLVAVMTEDDKPEEGEPRYVQGDAVVWRTK